MSLFCFGELQVSVRLKLNAWFRAVALSAASHYYFYCYGGLASRVILCLTSLLQVDDAGLVGVMYVVAHHR